MFKGFCFNNRKCSCAKRDRRVRVRDPTAAFYGFLGKEEWKWAESNNSQHLCRKENRWLERMTGLQKPVLGLPTPVFSEEWNLLWRRAALIKDHHRQQLSHFNKPLLTSCQTNAGWCAVAAFTQVNVVIRETKPALILEPLWTAIFLILQSHKLHHRIQLRWRHSPWYIIRISVQTQEERCRTSKTPPASLHLNGTFFENSKSLNFNIDLLIVENYCQKRTLVNRRLPRVHIKKVLEKVVKKNKVIYSVKGKCDRVFWCCSSKDASCTRRQAQVTWREDDQQMKQGEDTQDKIKCSCWTWHLFFKIISILINNWDNK